MVNRKPIPQELIRIILDLVEGRIEPDDWVAWWAENNQAMKVALPPGWYSRIKLMAHEEDDVSKISRSQCGGEYILNQLDISYKPSNRFHAVVEERSNRKWQEHLAAEKAKKKKFKPIIRTVKERFPKFGWLLSRMQSDIESLEPGCDDEHLAELNIELPESYRDFLCCTREVVIGDILQMTEMHPFIHRKENVQLPGEGMLCIADFWFDADGDQILLDIRDGADDPSVYYYSHEDSPPSVTQVSPSFEKWIESLSKKLSIYYC